MSGSARSQRLANCSCGVHTLISADALWECEDWEMVCLWERVISKRETTSGLKVEEEGLFSEAFCWFSIAVEW